MTTKKIGISMKISKFTVRYGFSIPSDQILRRLFMNNANHILQFLNLHIHMRIQECFNIYIPIPSYIR